MLYMHLSEVEGWQVPKYQTHAGNSDQKAIKTFPIVLVLILCSAASLSSRAIPGGFGSAKGIAMACFARCGTVAGGSWHSVFFGRQLT
jgi:hypothetical protein